LEAINRGDLVNKYLFGAKMNFIVFNPDEMRADHLACYGHPFIKTPNFDRLADEGVRFEQCHVQNTVCSPSRCSFMSGLYVHNTGHRSLWDLIKPWEPNLMKYLKNAGYDVAWYGKNDLLSFESLPESVTYSEDPAGEKMRQAKGDGSARFLSFLQEPYDSYANEHDHLLVKKGLEFLKCNHKKPFFLFLSTSQPHPPYSAPKEFYHLYEHSPVNLYRSKKNISWHKENRKYRRLNELDDETFNILNRMYCAQISYCDHLLGQIMNACRENGLDENTAIITFSDHGDYAGDYGMVEKWPNAMEDVLTRVPLIIRVPGNKKKHVVKEQIELFDFMPTVLELAGVPCTHHHFAHSLVSCLYGAAGSSDRLVFCEGGYDPVQDDEAFEGNPAFNEGLRDTSNIYYYKAKIQLESPETVCRTVMVRSMSHKLIRRSSGENELYALKEDPGENFNRYHDPALAKIQKNLEIALLDWYLKTSDTINTRRDDRGKNGFEIKFPGQ